MYHFFSRYLLTTYCVLGTFLRVGDILLNRRKIAVLKELRFHLGVSEGESDNGPEIQGGDMVYLKLIRTKNGKIKTRLEVLEIRQVSVLGWGQGEHTPGKGNSQCKFTKARTCPTCVNSSLGVSRVVGPKCTKEKKDYQKIKSER